LDAAAEARYDGRRRTSDSTGALAHSVNHQASRVYGRDMQHRRVILQVYECCLAGNWQLHVWCSAQCRLLNTCCSSDISGHRAATSETFNMLCCAGLLFKSYPLNTRW
jgi:hypothetical protein